MINVKQNHILIISVGVFVACLALAFLLSSVSFILSANLVIIGIITLTLPYSLYKFFEFRKVREYEKKFPAFLRDVADSQRAGLSFIQAMQLAGKNDYGELNREIKKINNQLSWNVPLEKVLDSFGNRMSGSKLIVRSLLIITRANKSGGNIEDTMESLANNIEMIKEVREEKSHLLNQQVMMLYAIFFIFLGISIAIIKFLVPLVSLPETGIGLEVIQFSANPCAECLTSSQNPACMGCQAFFIVGDAFAFGSKEEASTYYRSLFFVMIVIQGVFSGLIAGEIGSESISAGIKHSLIMVFSGAVAFLIFVRIGFI